jgi:hypothetical protein
LSTSSNFHRFSFHPSNTLSLTAMRAIAVLLCALYAVSAQNQDPTLPQVVVLNNAQGQNNNQAQNSAAVNSDDLAARNAANRYLAPAQRPTVVAVSYQRPQPAQTNYAQQGQNVNYQAQGQDAQILSAVDASRAQIAAAVQQGANPNRFGIQTNARYQIAQAPNAQNPDVFTALDALRGRNDLTIDEILNILANAVAGRDYPIYNEIPSTRFSCENVHQAGFYADAEAQCQVIRRCDINGVLWSYLCPNMTLFNQITLVCDWFFNVNCNNAVQYYDYSNPRLYTQFALLDTPNQAYVRPVQTQGYVLANQPQYNQQG